MTDILCYQARIPDVAVGCFYCASAARGGRSSMSIVRSLLITGCQQARRGNRGIAQAWEDARVTGGLELGLPEIVKMP